MKYFAAKFKLIALYQSSLRAGLHETPEGVDKRVMTASR
jgi:hypothetical protein